MRKMINLSRGLPANLLGDIVVLVLLTALAAAAQQQQPAETHSSEDQSNTQDKNDAA
jgi:hypothetical protein